MDNRDLLKKYVNTGRAIPYNQYKKLQQIPPLFKSYQRARNIAAENSDDYKLELYELSDEELASLKIIDFANKNLTEIPDYIFYKIDLLNSLKRLSLQKNIMQTLPDSIGNLFKLESLHLHGNQLTVLPDSIGNLVNLKSLIVDKNQLTVLPDSFGNLISLESLSIGNNKLTTLPDSFGNLKNLFLLDLKNNKLTTLPDSFGNLISLEDLNLENNELTTLPDSIGNLKNLRTLELLGNPIDSEEINKLNRLLPRCRISIKRPELNIYRRF